VVANDARPLGQAGKPSQGLGSDRLPLQSRAATYRLFPSAPSTARASPRDEYRSSEFCLATLEPALDAGRCGEGVIEHGLKPTQ